MGESTVPLFLNAILRPQVLTNSGRARGYHWILLSQHLTISLTQKLRAVVTRRCCFIEFSRLSQTFNTREYTASADTSARRRQFRIIHGPDWNKPRAVFTQFLDPRRWFPLHNRIKIITDIVYELRTFLKNTGMNVSLKEVFASSADINVRDYFGITEPWDSRNVFQFVFSL